MEQPVSWPEINFFINLIIVVLNTVVIFTFVWHTRDLKLQVGDIRRVLVHRTSLFLSIAEAVKDRDMGVDIRQKLDEVVSELRKMNQEEGYDHDNPDADLLR